MNAVSPVQPGAPADADHDKMMALMALGANFGKEMPEPLLDIWLDLLAPYPPEAVNMAVKKVIATYAYKMIPPFAVLRKALDEVCGHGAPTVKLQATAEWARLLRFIETRGSYSPPETPHPTTAYVVGLMGGWKTVCAWTEDALPFKQRDFLTHWETCHGNVDILALGADGVARALERGRSGALPAAKVAGMITHGKKA